MNASLACRNQFAELARLWHVRPRGKAPTASETRRAGGSEARNPRGRQRRPPFGQGMQQSRKRDLGYRNSSEAIVFAGMASTVARAREAAEVVRTPRHPCFPLVVIASAVAIAAPRGIERHTIPPPHVSPLLRSTE
jgi:hypothetical protein